MKLLYSLALIGVMGCASYMLYPRPHWIATSCTWGIQMESYCPAGFRQFPVPRETHSDWNDAQVVNRALGMRIVCIPSGLRFLIPAPATWSYSDSGSISHVTREQWEAAQGLYNPSHSYVTYYSAINTTSGILFSTSTGTTAVAHFKKPRLCPKGEHRALIDIPIQREGVACAGASISDCAEHHVIDVCEKNHNPIGDTFPPSGDAK